MAGYIIRSDDARVMEAEWQGVLDSFGIETFHMADCAADPGNGPFKLLSKDERISLVTSLIEIIKNRTIAGVSVITNPSDYVGLFNKSDTNPSLTPYSNCLFIMMLTIGMNWCHDNKFFGKILYNFEAGYKDQGYASRFLDKLFSEEETKDTFHYAGHSFITKNGSCLLQAADILAWQSSKDMKMMLTQKNRRKDFDSILSHPHYFIYVSSKNSSPCTIYVDNIPSYTDENKRKIIEDFFRDGGSLAKMSYPEGIAGMMITEDELLKAIAADGVFRPRGEAFPISPPRP